MNLVLPTPSLQHLALVKGVAQLWNHQDILSRIILSISDLRAAFSREESNEWQEIEDKVKEKVSVLLLPQVLKDLLLNFVKPLGIELLDWCICYYEENKDQIAHLMNLPEQICWTMRGTVDYKKTAELMVKDDSMDVLQRYKIACANCLEDEIRRLINHNNISEHQKSEIMNNTKKPGIMHLQHLMFFWTCSLNVSPDWRNNYFRKRGKLDYAYAYDCANSSKNRAGCVYLFGKLNQRERDQVLCQFKCLFNRSANMVVFDLFPQTSEKQREKLFKNSFTGLLACLLHWPRQSLFVKTAKHAWSREPMGIGNYVYMLHAVVEKMRQGFKDYNYAQLFWEFWYLSPDDYKNRFLGEFEYVKGLFEIGEGEFILLVLNEAPSYLVSLLAFDENNEVRGILMDESVILDETLKEIKRKVELDLVNVERYEENKWKCHNLSRILESRIQKNKSINI